MTRPRSILIVEDEEAIAWSLQRALARGGHSVRTASSAEQGLRLAASERPDAVILDVRLPGMDGLTALEKFRPLTGDAPVIIITAFGSLDTAVRAVAAGAFDYLVKPFDLRQALDAVARALERPPPSPDAIPSPTADEIIGTSPAIQTVFKRIALVAPRDACVLVAGESGTGKELVARAIHRYSPRRDRPFVPIHVAALNPALVESELFGHVKGAFTGATQSRPGLLALAEGGTVLLDEIAEVPLGVQVKLLRALEQREVYPVGGTEPVRLDVRLIAATHRDLAALVAEGRFREDLFFRLDVFAINLPPLRERRGDIPALAEHFLRRLAPAALPLPQPTLDFLRDRSWPGNVRELRNALEHASVVSPNGPLRTEDFPPPARANEATVGDRLAAAVRAWAVARVDAPNGVDDLYADMLRLAEPPLFEEVIRRVQGNRWEAGRRLGLNRATVRKKLAEYGLADIGDEKEPRA